MAGRKSDFTLSTKSLDDLFSTQEERDEAKLSKIYDRQKEKPAAHGNGLSHL